MFKLINLLEIGKAVLVGLIIFLSSCNCTNDSDACITEIDSMRVCFIKGNLVFNSGNIDCESFEKFISLDSMDHIMAGMSPNSVDTTIYDCNILSRIGCLLDSCSFDTAKELQVDVRIKCLLFRKVKIDTLCIGNESEVMMNNKFLSMTELLVYYIRKSINYYKYYPSEAFESFSEIKYLKRQLKQD